MTKINEFDDKYLVLNWEDINKLPKKQFDKMAEIINDIGSIRTKEGKTYLNKLSVCFREDELTLRNSPQNKRDFRVKFSLLLMTK